MDYSDGMSDSMRAIVMRESGDADVLEIQDVERPTPGEGDLLVRVASSGVNRADLLQRAGRYPAPPGYHEHILGRAYSGTGGGLSSRGPGNNTAGGLGGGNGPGNKGKAKGGGKKS